MSVGLPRSRSLGSDDLTGHIVLGRYRVVRAIGRGGMGIVYLARTEGAAGFVKPVVIKRTLPQLEGADVEAKLSAREARIMANLRHPGIVSVLDFAEEDGSYLLVLDYVHGYTLGQWHRFTRRMGRRFSWELACHVLANVLDALHYSHTLVGPHGEQLEVVHRDVSPSNVLVDVEGHVKLADFGVARMRSDMTEGVSNAVKGKISYMAPEVLALGEPSPKSDVYACGVVLHELLTGTNELRGADIGETSARVLGHAFSPPSAQRSDLPKELDALVLTALSRSPAERPDALLFAQALRNAQIRPLDELSTLLAAEVAADFRNPEMAAFLGTEGLAALDSAWRAPPEAAAPATVPEMPIASAMPESGPTLHERAPRSDSGATPVRVVSREAAPDAPAVAGELALPPDARASSQHAATELAAVSTSQHHSAPAPSLRVKRPTWTFVLVAVALASAIGGGIASVASRRAGVDYSTVDTPVIVVQNPGSAATPPAAGAVSEAAPSMPAPAAAAPAVSARLAQAPSAPVVRPDRLTRVFAQRKAQVARCFAQHQTNDPTSELAVRFQIDTAGKVVDSQVLPSRVAASPLGACIANVARAIDFGPQPTPVSFRVPISAHRVSGKP